MQETPNQIRNAPEVKVSARNQSTSQTTLHKTDDTRTNDNFHETS